MRALAKPGATKVEAQDGKTESVQRFGCVIHNFVVHRSAMKRMRMADERRVRSILLPGVQQRFKPSCGPGEKKRLDCVWQELSISILAAATVLQFRDCVISR